jgi:hypothetical protein
MNLQKMDMKKKQELIGTSEEINYFTSLFSIKNSDIY